MTAINGHEGTSNDPYIVDNWSDFITAVGTSNAYVEFPKNLVLTRDTQIVEGKLYVDSTGEPITNPVPSGLSGYYENTFVLDQNDYAPEGLTNIIYIVCNSLNGYGGKITNLYFTSTYYFDAVNNNYTKISNINFDNIIVRTQGWFIYYNGIIQKCIFSATIESGFIQTGFNLLNTGSARYGEKRIKNCSAYIKNNSNKPCYFNSGNIDSATTQYNRIIIDAPESTFGVYALNNSLITGKCNSLTVTSGNYSVIDCTISNGASFTNETQCLINSDKVTGTITGGTSVTSEQMINAEDLASIGFPIQT